MKNRLLFTALIGMFLFVNPLMAQEDSSATENVEMIAEGAEESGFFCSGRSSSGRSS